MHEDSVGSVPGREEAAALRESLDPDERERVEATVATLLDLLGKTHTMALLREFAFAEGPVRFGHLEETLAISPSTLSERLRELTAAGLLRRRSYDEIPPRVEYEPTARARALFPAFAHLHRWAIDHRLEPEG
ncbi:winged helix-turn-helix transcriptional regulator [Natronorarus salvus]|uniref:winged helix-turn-helix transcriptional regulator n=1 Tax=Natronorarus salvus TaxID=3117733 RepID=UPI002F26B3CB